MLLKRFSFLCVNKSIKLCRPIITGEPAEDIRRNSPKYMQRLTFLTKLLDINYKRGHEILEKYTKFLVVNTHEIEKTVYWLKLHKFGIKEIQEKPALLSLSTLTLENRYSILEESGFKDIHIETLDKFLRIMNREISLLKINKIIPYETNVPDILASHFSDKCDIESTKHISNNIKLVELRKIILDEYFSKILKASKEDINKIWKVYPRIRHRSFDSIKQMIDILKNDLKFSNERIIKNAYTIHGEPDNVRRILRHFETIGSEPIKSVLYRRPKIMMSQSDSIERIIRYIKLYNIPETSINTCLELLTLSSETVLERLRDLKETEEFNVLVTNPRVLRLVHYQIKAKERLAYLNTLRVKCASLHILSCTSETFEKYARDGIDKSKGKDLIVFLSKILKRKETDLRPLLSRHPNWCHIPLLSVKECYDFLITNKFSQSDIYNNIHIVLYPVNQINDKLSQLQNPKSFNEMFLEINSSHITNSQLLGLCLYIIEKEYHFSGDGIWSESQQNTSQIENFNQILPDFPGSSTKNYKYGVKPRASKCEIFT